MPHTPITARKAQSMRPGDLPTLLEWIDAPSTQAVLATHPAARDLQTYLDIYHACRDAGYDALGPWCARAPQVALTALWKADRAQATRRSL